MKRARFTLCALAAATSAGVAVPALAQSAGLPSIGQILAANSRYSRFLALAKKTDLASRFSGQAGPFTLFVPVNSGFANLDPNFAASAQHSGSASKVRFVLMYHVVDKQLRLNQFKEGTLRSAAGQPLVITVGNGFVYVNGNALGDPIQARNGIVYPIENVLIPSSIGDK
jgi:uncharacterized surface protein with fasciclin (FAS1) repeats